VETIGTYPVLKILGRGPNGVVREGFDPAQGRKIAIKALEASSTAASARFLRDALAAGSLGHPNLATVWEVGEHQGRPFVAMELVEGVDLQQVLRSQKPLLLERTLDLLRQICEGLAHAHRNGVFHLDLKPTDLRITPQGDVKILDFGVTHLKSPPRQGGGPAPNGIHYRAPEQLEGRRTDARADIFSVGAIAYELLALRKAFPGDDVATVLRSMRSRRPDPIALPESAFSPGLEAIVLRALAPDPAARPACFEDLHADLVRLVRQAAPELREHGREPARAGARGPAREEDLRTELARARAEDQLQRALEICERLLELDPEDEEMRRTAYEIEAVARDREVEQLCGLALSYAADGEVELAGRIAEKVERVAPWSPRYLRLQIYLDEEAAKGKVAGLIQSARDHLAQGRVAEARAAAEEALNLEPGQPQALEILKSPSPGSTPPGPPPAASPPSRLAATRRAQVESLTSAALNHFVGNDHGKAKEAVERALALDPGNRKAMELKQILGTLR
jgi:tetratricopeptide (TPR) repeat protein